MPGSSSGRRSFGPWLEWGRILGLWQARRQFLRLLLAGWQAPPSAKGLAIDKEIRSSRGERLLAGSRRRRSVCVWTCSIRALLRSADVCLCLSLTRDCAGMGRALVRVPRPHRDAAEIRVVRFLHSVAAGRLVCRD